MIKYNRFLYYIEYNKVDSKEFAEFLLPNSEIQFYAPIYDNNNYDTESLASSYSPPAIN